jgi:PAS domain S-box-containing protein
MFIKSICRVFDRISNKANLRIVLIVPFVLPIVGAVEWVGHLSLRNEQQAVNDVASQLRREISDRISDRIGTSLNTPDLIALISNPQGGFISVASDERGLSGALTESFTRCSLCVHGVRVATLVVVIGIGISIAAGITQPILRLNASAKKIDRGTEALRQSEERFREILGTSDRLFFVRSASSGQFLYVSPAYEKIWGRSCESLYENPQLWMEALHPDDRQLVLDCLHRQFQGNPVKREYRIIRDDGCIRWITADISVVRDEAGQPLRFVGVAEDISDRKQVEEALRKSEDRNRALLNAIPDLIIRMAKDGTYLDFWPAKNFDTVVSGSDFIGKSIYEIMPPEVSQERMHYVEQALATETTQTYEFQLVKDGSIYEQEARIVVCGDDEVLVIVRDITARKHAEEALRHSEARERERAQALKLTLQELQRTQAQLIQSEKMSSLGQMIAGIAHEINNPISFIYGNLTPARHYFQDLLSLLVLYQETYPHPKLEIQQRASEIELDFLLEDWQKLIDSMEVGADRICEIVRSLRNFSRLDEKELKPVDIHEGIDNTLLILQHRLRAEGNSGEIKVIKDYGQLPLVICYASQLNQVFMNLLSNAIDALKQEPGSRSHKSGVIPTITIHTDVRERKKSPTLNSPSIIVRIADNGSGMSAEVQQKIFDPFFTTKPIGSGTGLGLSICYQIVVEKHKGHISCASTLGQGTEFIVEIPVRQTNIEQ